MPSSHLRMEEATSIIASKSISDGFERPDIDELDDFVLQIDENEINNEIKENGLVEDVANDVFKKNENNEEKTIMPLKALIETEDPLKCRTNSEPENGVDKNSCDVKDRDQSHVTSNINGLSSEQNVEMEAETESQNDSETSLKINSSVTTNINGLSKMQDVEMEAVTESQNNSDTDLKTGTSISTVSKKNDTENITMDQKMMESSNVAVSIEAAKEENKTSLASSDFTEENGVSNLSESAEAWPGKIRDRTNEFASENLESVDKELDSLLSVDLEISNKQSKNISEPMEVDPPPNELPVMNISTIEHSPSVLLELQNQDDKMDSHSDSNDHNTAPDSPTITMHSPQTLNELDENSSSSDGFLKEKTVKGFSNVNTEGGENETLKEEYIYHKVKHIQISAQSNVLKENINSEKRLKREADEETNGINQKKIKLDQENNIKEETTIENNLEDEGESNPIETFKKESDLDSESSCDSGSSTGSDSSDESVDMNDTDTLHKIAKMNHKLINEELSPEELKEIMEGREKLFTNYFEGKTDITINRFVLEEMVMTQIIEMISYKTDVGQLRQKCRILQNEQIRLNQMMNALRKQADNARLIIKKLIDEKSNNKSWTQTAIPLKVTRSVGLQVCTCGSMTVRSKVSDKEFRPIKSENVTKESSTITCEAEKENDVNKVGSFDNKENISSNIEKDVVSNKDSSNSDDVVIVSVTENNSTSSSSTMDKTNKSTIKKILEAPKNGIVPTEKLVRRPLSISPTVPNKTSTVSNQKKMATDSSVVEKELSQTLKPDVSEIIDLTDKEDHPVKKLGAPSKSVPASTSSEKHAPGVVEKLKKTISPQPSPLVAVNGIKKPSLPSSTATNKKSGDIAPAADLVNSYDHLPKYPVSPKYPPNVVKPPRPILRIGKNTSGKQGIMLSWSFEGGRNPPNIEEYQLYAYQESKNTEKLKTDTWKKVGDIKALPLPMACFLTQFVEGHKYHFIVRAVDTQKRLGDFSLPGSIILHAAGQPPSAS